MLNFWGSNLRSDFLLLKFGSGSVRRRRRRVDSGSL